MNEFNIARNYSIEDLDIIRKAFEQSEKLNRTDFPCRDVTCSRCPFNTLKGRCGGTSSVITAKYGKSPDWRSLEFRWEQEVIGSGADIKEPEDVNVCTPDRIVISLTARDARVLSEYISRTNETLVVPTTMLAVSGYVKRLIDASLKHGNKDGD